MNDVEKWLKRANRKGPFYLYKIEPLVREWLTEQSGNQYYLIWNDKDRTCYGSVHDEMLCRYGFDTITVLKGDTKFDLWNGKCIDDDIFNEMIKVRNGLSTLPMFDLSTINNIGW